MNLCYLRLSGIFLLLKDNFMEKILDIRISAQNCGYQNASFYPIWTCLLSIQRFELPHITAMRWLPSINDLFEDIG